jgi:hypothetical protein
VHLSLHTGEVSERALAVVEGLAEGEGEREGARALKGQGVAKARMSRFPPETTMTDFVPKEELSALVSATLATPEFSGKDMTLKNLRKEVERRLGKALPKEQKPEFTDLVTEAMTAANKMG